jgi:hypothetical protein
MTTNEKIKRSVDSLEKIYTIVIALSVTKAIDNVITSGFAGASNYEKLINNWPALLAFIVTIAPFYHGMHRHLSRVYIERDIDSKKQGFLLLDFLIFFLEACALLIFASSLTFGTKAFIPLIFLLIIDSLWAIIAHGIYYDEWENSPWKWSVINLSAVFVMSVIVYSNLFLPEYRPIALAAAAFIRTTADYWICWGFYFPSDET